MRRRSLIILLGGAAFTGPLKTRAQQQKALPLIGFLSGGTPNFDANLAAGFRKGLSEAGYDEGRNVIIEYRWAEGENGRLPGLAADLVARQVSVIAAANTPAVAAAKAATGKIPIVFSTGADPVAVGFAESLNRPGGNLTGVTFLGAETGPKQFELLHEMVVTASTIALLLNPSNRTLTEPLTREAQASADRFGLKLHVLHASTEDEIDAAFATLRQAKADGLVIGPDLFFTNRSQRLAALSVMHKVPAIYHYREFTIAGGLMSYGGSVADAFRLAGVYTGRILDGKKPADLPVQQPTKFDLVINFKTAKVRGLTAPQSLLARADEVIE